MQDVVLFIDSHCHLDRLDLTAHDGDFDAMMRAAADVFMPGLGKNKDKPAAKPKDPPKSSYLEKASGIKNTPSKDTNANRPEGFQSPQYPKPEDVSTPPRTNKYTNAQRHVPRPGGGGGDDDDGNEDDEEKGDDEEQGSDPSDPEDSSDDDVRTGRRRNPPARFSVNPESLYANRILDYSKKAQKAIYTAATKSLYADNADRYNLDTANAQNFLQRVQDWCLDSSLTILNVPKDYKELEKIGNVPESQIYYLNICKSHRYLTHQAVEAYVATFVNTRSRVFQEDWMLASSLTEKAFLSITMDPDTYEVKGHQSGLMLLKTILDKSPINSSIDPDVIRKEIANANLKFKELGWDVRLFNDWIVLKQAQLTQSGQRSSDITAHLWTAYLDSQDKEFKDFIVKLRDDVLIKDPRDLSVAKLMGFAKKKFDQLETERRLMAVERKRDDEFVALQMKIKKFEKRDRAGGPAKQHQHQPMKDKKKAAEKRARKKEKKEAK